MQRILIASFAPVLCFGASIASATPVVVAGLPPLPQILPTRCEPLSRVPASATIPGPMIAAHISVANCLAEVAMNELIFAPNTASIEQVDGAVASAVALFDDVIRLGEPYWTVIAQDAKRDLYLGMVIRERASLLAGDPAAHAVLESKLGPWKDDAARAQAAIASVVKANPELGQRDPVIGHAVARVEVENRHDRLAHRAR